ASLPGHPIPSPASFPHALSSQADRLRVLESLGVLIQQPSCKVVLAVSLLLGAGGLYLWFQGKKKTLKKSPACKKESAVSAAIENKSDPWIKSHFSRLSDEKLCALLQEGGSGEAGSAHTNMQVETCTSRIREGKNADIRKEAYITRQRTSGSKVFKECHKESSKSNAADETAWASVASCVHEIDLTGRQLADSMLQRAARYQHSGHLETKDINKEELKALEEVEMKVKGNFLTRWESNMAGSSNTYHNHGYHSQPPHSQPPRGRQASHAYFNLT
ncbi:uncharacterized protein C10orf62 homolog, partial [Antechinus flavipes]|uniref:uncharacterized protein C10orf62 homolog n=1 Tax=Antechinus flavipes TaxID=38775 RepID=UPI0022360B90